jgi:hypothetical protein
MDDELIDGLDSLLTLEEGSTSFDREDIPEQLRDTEYIEEDFRPPTRCPVVGDCRAACDHERDGSIIQVACDEGHEGTLSVEEHTYYDIAFESLMRAIAAHLGRELSNLELDTRPRYVSGTTADGFNIYLIISPSDYEKTVNEICMETLREDTPALLITPENSIFELLEIQSLFAAGNLIYTVPFTMLTEPGEIQASLETITEIQALEQQFIQQQADSDHPVVLQANSNPRYILTELNHMRLLRMAGELPQSSGTRLEKIGESVFSHLFVTYPETGGEDDRGTNLPDSIFYIADHSLPEGYDSILGIVDTKSGKDASFRTEPVEGKHDEYLERGHRQSVAADQLAHIFVILAFDGQQEIEFYDEMAERYREGEYMVIFTAEALAMIMTAYLAHTVSNELKLVEGDFQTTIYPFFHQDRFRDAGLASITREVGQNQDEYDDAYMQRDGLLIVTKDVVKQRLQDCVESPGEVEHILSSYYREMPTV